MNRRTDLDRQRKKTIMRRCGMRHRVRSGRVAPTGRGRTIWEKKVLTLEIARKIVTAAESEAIRHHLAGVVAGVDDGGGQS
jgi:hypothetical protein